MLPPFEEGMNLTEHIKRYQHTLLKMQQLREARVIDYINAITIEPVGMKNERIANFGVVRPLISV